MDSENQYDTIQVEAPSTRNGSITDWKAIRELDYLVASRLIKDSRDLRNLTFKKTEKDLKSYEWYLNPILSYGLQIVILVHLLLPIIEEPSYLGVNYLIPCLIEILCLLVYLIRWVHSFLFQTNSSFYKDKKNYVSIITIILILIDVIIFIWCKSIEVKYARRYLRALRVLIYVNLYEGKELRRAMRNVRKTIPDILNVFALFFISLLIFAFVGWQLFKGRVDVNKKILAYSNGQSYFQNFEDSLWDLYISVTTANFPDVMMPAYDLNGAYAIFFLVFMLINLYIFINIILATIYTNYKKHLKEEVKEAFKLKREKMKDAFNHLRIPLNCVTKTDEVILEINEYIKSNIHHVIDKNVFMKLMKLTQPKMSESQIGILFDLIDFDKNGLLSFKEFVYLSDLLNIKMSEINDRKTLFELYTPAIYNSRASNILKNLVKHKIFQMFFDLLILLNIVFVILSPNNGAEWIFLIAFLVEILLKIYVEGLKEFIKKHWNKFDTVVIISGLIAGIVSSLPSDDAKGGATEFFEVVLILRSMRLLKFVASINRFRTIITTVAIITPSLITYGMLLLSIFYIFSMVGMEIFGQVIQTQDFKPGQVYDCSNKNLIDTDFTKLKYCKNNFSTFLNSIVLLFELMVVNQWHILSRGFEDALGTKWVRLFFFSFHISCVIISLNIFTAFIIEAFLLEYETESDQAQSANSKLESRIIDLGLAYEETDGDDIYDTKTSFWDKTIEFFRSLKDILNDTEKNREINNLNGFRFHINSKEAKPVEILLQRMFADECDLSEDD